MAGVVIIVLMVAGYFVLRNGILKGATDSVTAHNTKRLSRMVLYLCGAGVLLILLFAVCNPHP